MKIQFKKDKNRIIVMTDISSLQGGFMEPDDTQSLVRLLLYSTDFDMEGISLIKNSNTKYERL